MGGRGIKWLKLGMSRVCWLGLDGGLDWERMEYDGLSGVLVVFRLGESGV